MASFYTDVSMYRDEILLRGYSEGKRITSRIEYRPYLFLPDKDPKANSTFRTMDGRPVRRRVFDTIRAARSFAGSMEDVKEETFFGSTNWVGLFTYDSYPGEIEADHSLMSVVTLDIEVASGENGYAPPSDPFHEVIAISLRKNGKTYSLGLKPYYPKDPSVHYLMCRHEKHLLRKFLELWDSEEWGPDIVTGWNISFYDIPYLVNRINRVLGDNQANELSPWGYLRKRKAFVFGREEEIFLPVGIQVLDYKELYEKFSSKKQEKYSLDHICFVELKEQKLDYSDYGSLQDLYEGNINVNVENPSYKEKSNAYRYARLAKLAKAKLSCSSS